MLCCSVGRVNVVSVVSVGRVSSSVWLCCLDRVLVVMFISVVYRGKVIWGLKSWWC